MWVLPYIGSEIGLQVGTEVLSTTWLFSTMNFRLQLTFIKNYLTTQIALNFHQQVNTFNWIIVDIF